MEWVALWIAASLPLGIVVGRLLRAVSQPGAGVFDLPDDL